MKNNQGITLIEILASLVVLALISAIVVPNIFGLLKGNKEDLYQNQVSMIEDASKNWAADHIDELPILVGEIKKVTIQELQDGGYLDENYTNVKTNKPFNATSYVSITCTLATDTNYQYQYQFHLT